MFGIFDPGKQVVGAFYRWDTSPGRDESWYSDYKVQVCPAPPWIRSGETETVYELRERLEPVLIKAGFRPTLPPCLDKTHFVQDQRYLAQKWADALSPIDAVAEALGVTQGILVRATYGAWGTSHLPRYQQDWEIRFELWDAPASRGEELMAAEHGVVGDLFGRG